MMMMMFIGTETCASDEVLKERALGALNSLIVLKHNAKKTVQSGGIAMVGLPSLCSSYIFLLTSFDHVVTGVLKMIDEDK